MQKYRSFFNGTHMRIATTSLITILAMLVLAGPLHAESDSANCNMNGRGMGWCRNNQGSGCDKRFGGCYGARQPVKSIEEARKQLEAYYADRKDVVIGGIEERRWGYEAQILDSNKKLVDRVMLHRQTGRIRSMY
jgi:hypothetical protein